MKINLERKNVVFLVVFVMVGASIIPSVLGMQETSNNDVENIIINVQNNDDTISINYQISEFSSKKILVDGEEYLKIILGEESNIMISGKPDLPNICRSVLIPDNSKMNVRVVSSEYKEYNNIKIIPSKGNLLRNVNPEDIPYEFDELYNQNTWFPNEIVGLREPYIIHEFRGQVVGVNPIQYNPYEEKLRFYTDITVEVFPDGLSSINCIDRDELPSSVDSDFMQIYSRHFLNSEKLFNNRYTPVEEKGNMLVITYDDFWDAMIPFVQWKNMKGIPTEMVNVSTIGDANAIKSYIQDYYDENGLTFLLLVGDAAQVPPYLLGSMASDPTYSYVAGADKYPDLFVGRFSAQNLNQLDTQIERSLEYERNPQIGAEWYQKGVGVASSQGPGDDGEMDHEHIRNIRTKLMDYGYTEVDELYDGSQGGEDEPGNPTPSMVAEALNDGRSITNYCGHGSPSSWGSSGFSTSDINSLINDNMLPYVTCVACNNGQFDDYDECFCEAWLRATNDGEPAGAIVATGSSKSMGWNPPMDAQDEMNDLVVESYTDNVKHTFGGIHNNGVMHMNDEYGSSGESETDAWHLFGDPSLQIRTAAPTEMSVIHESIIPIGSTTFELEVEGIQDALCAISYNHELLGCGFTDEDGIALINFSEMQFYEGGIDLIVTAYNMVPYNVTVLTGSSYPPEPPEVGGPQGGKPAKEYEFSAITTDPEEDQVFYLFDWGDGSKSDWLGPYDSGEEITTTHAWSEIGDYEVKVKAKDVEDSSSKWCDPYPVQIVLPELNIKNIRGGFFKVTSKIVNPGIAEAEDISWTITLDGGMILLGKESTGHIDTILPGEEEQITSGTIIGFGETTVFVTADIPEGSTEHDQGGKMFFFIITVNPGGN
jgi:hypothetical protein